jgi:hypothetical protein
VTELRIPDAALHAAGRAAAPTELSGAAIVAIVRAAAPHVVAAELRRLAEAYWNQNSISVAELRHWLRDRANELDPS